MEVTATGGCGYIAASAGTQRFSRADTFCLWCRHVTVEAGFTSIDEGGYRGALMLCMSR